MDDFFMREGWLQKKGVEGLKSWSKRYFTLEDEELYYYENKGDVAPKGRILLTDIQKVDSVSGSFWSRGFYFNLVTKDRTYELCADDDNERKEWISILQRASAHFKKMAKEMQQPVNTQETFDANDMNDEDDEHVELTEEDMNDPDLLGELTELHGKEGLVEHLKELNAKIDSEKQKCIQLRDAGNIEEAKKLLLRIKNLQNQKESLEIKIKNFDKQEELEEEMPEEAPQEEEPVEEAEEPEVEEEEEPSHDDTKSSATEESLIEVERRIEGFKNLALNAKKQGNVPQATQYMKSYKILLQAKEQLDVGIQMDLSKLPALDPALPTTSSTSPTTSAPTSSSRPKSNSIPPTPTKNLEAERLEALSILEEELRRQWEVAKSKALAAKEKGDKHTALEQLNITKDVKHHLEEIIKAKSLPHVPVPKYHFEVKEHVIEKKHDDLLENEVEISLKNCKGIKEPSITSPYFHVLFPYPNSEDPQKSSSSSFSPKSTDFQHTCKMTIERKKSFQIFCERKKITIEMYQSRLLLSSILLGKGELKMSALLEKCETSETIEIKNGRKLICVVDVFVRLKKPVAKQQHVEKIQEKVLVIDEHYTSTPVPETPKESPKEAPKETPKPVEKVAEQSKPSPVISEPPSEEDYTSVDYLISNDVLEFEKELLTAKINALKGQATEELLDRKQAVELKLQILSVQASTGQLDQDKYIQDMRDKIVVEKKLAGKLSKEGNKEAALMAMKRVKIMEKEIEASLE